MKRVDTAVCLETPGAMEPSIINARWEIIQDGAGVFEEPHGIDLEHVGELLEFSEPFRNHRGSGGIRRICHKGADRKRAN